jgi:ABC-type Fe3+-hydroxamate transport system substrate-binding protein
VNYTDACGTRHAVASAGARLVCLVPSITELLFDLDLGPHVVGRTSFCIHPASSVANVTRVGGTKTPRLDRIAKLHASHAIVNIDENRLEDVDALRQMGIQIIATHPCEPNDNLLLYRLLGAVFNREAEAHRLCQRFTAALNSLRAQAQRHVRQRVLYLIWRDPWMSVSTTTYIARMLATAGLDVVTSKVCSNSESDMNDEQRYPQLAVNAELLGQVDRVLLSSEPYPFKESHRKELRALAGADGPPVTFIDGEMTSWYGSRAIIGCEYLARLRAERIV